MEALEDLKAIRDNKPEGATHIDDAGTYWKVVSEFDYYFYDGSQWDGSEPLYNGTRSLSDIERIIELMETNKEAKKCALLSLKEAIEPDGLINSEAGLKTIKTIQNAIDNIVRRL